MSPATKHQFPIECLKALVNLITVTLYCSLKAVQQQHGRLLGTGTSVIVEEDLAIVRIANNPQVTLNSTLLLIVDNGDGAFVYLNVIGRQDPSTKMVIEWFEQLAALGEPVSHCGRAYPHPKIRKPGYLPVKGM